jgi:dipeptidyl aminopeptidase/acylaminoacyl peptidase
MTFATRIAETPQRWPLPLRALLHAALLRGLRPPRLPHGPGWPDGAFEEGTLSIFHVHGTRGQRLVGWLALPPTARPEHPAPVVVALHGWGANGSTLSPLVAPLVRAGVAVVLFDAANHGDSSSEAFSSLPRFAEDLASVLGRLAAEPALDAGRVALIGHSVGAGAVLLHAARRGGVRAIVSLSAFAHPREVMERWLHEHRIPRRWIGTAILEHVQDVIGERFDAIAPEHQLPCIGCPVLLVHGAQDRTVPLSDARRLRAALRQGELLVVDGDHDLRAALEPHTERLVQFLRMHFDVETSDPGGHVLSVADGEGRNSVWLARHGCATTPTLSRRKSSPTCP